MTWKKRGATSFIKVDGDLEWRLVLMHPARRNGDRRWRIEGHRLGPADEDGSRPVTIVLMQTSVQSVNKPKVWADACIALQEDREECEQLAKAACSMDAGTYQQAIRILFAVRDGTIQADVGRGNLERLVQ